MALTGVPLGLPATLPDSATPVVISGIVTDSSGRPAPGGWVEFSLIPESLALAYSIPPDINVATPTRGFITSDGSLVSDLETMDPFVVWPNDIMVPGNSLYQVIIAPRGRVSRVLQGVLIQSRVNPQSVAKFTFVAPQSQVVGTIVNGNPLVTQSVVPAISEAFTVGTRRRRYLRGYFANLYADCMYVKNLYVENWVVPPEPPKPPEPEGPVPYTYSYDSSNILGQPQPGQVVMLYTCFVQTIFPPNFTNPTSYGGAITNPQATAVYSVFQNSTPVGQVSISPAGVFSFSTAGFTLNPGDLFWATAPNPMDATLSDVALAFVGTRSS